MLGCQYCILRWTRKLDKWLDEGPTPNLGASVAAKKEWG